MRRFIMFMGMLSLILDLYVFQGIKRLTAGWQNTTLRKGLFWFYWIFSISFSLCFMYVVYLRFSTDVATPFMKFVMNSFLTLFITKLVFVLFLFAEDIIRVLVAAVNLIKNSGSGKAMPGRRKFVSQAGIMLAGIPFVGFIYGIAKGKYDFTVHKLTLYFDDLPAAFDGFKITQLSDFHAGSFDDAEEVKRGLQMAHDQASDLIVFTGDLVNDRADEVVPFKPDFKSLKAPFGQFSVLGNHDYGMYHEWPSPAAEQKNLQDLKDHHGEMGFKLLLDESVEIEKGGEKLALIGVENWGKGFIQIGDLDRALKNVDQNAFKILLSHDPTHYEEIVKNHPANVHLTLSGHTHGMQVGVETPLFKWSPARFRYKTWAGLAEENGRRLYVNRGFGFIGFNGRVGIWPEITVLELKKGKSRVEYA